MDKYVRGETYFAETQDEVIQLIYDAYKDDPILRCCPYDDEPLQKIGEDQYQCPVDGLVFSQEDIIFWEYNDEDE